MQNSISETVRGCFRVYTFSVLLQMCDG